jgi:DNA-binding NtrC family response regulator
MHNQQPLQKNLRMQSLTSGSARIFLAEDHAAFRRLLALRLRLVGFDVVEADSGAQVLDQLANPMLNSPPIPVHLIIADVRIPGCSGLDLLASLRLQGSQIPVILITAFGDATTHAAAARLGAFAMLDKPFEIDDLLDLAISAVGHGNGNPEVGSE